MHAPGESNLINVHGPFLTSPHSKTLRFLTSAAVIILRNVVYDTGENGTRSDYQLARHAFELLHRLSQENDTNELKELDRSCQNLLNLVGQFVQVADFP